ncbi:MAG: copper transporter [Actinobacteria bacterium]|nr:copper transporter [Actinomycetota bacterium]
MLTWRYHLLSLVAVFLALGLGVLVGISLTDSGFVETSQNVLVNDIQKNVEDLQGRNDQLSHERSTNLRYQDDTFPFIVGGRLQGKRIALVAAATAGDDIIRNMTSAIHGAGGQVVSTTILNPLFDAAAVTPKVKNDMKGDPLFATVDDSSMTSAVGRGLARDIGRGGGVKLLASLQGTLVDSISGGYDLPVDAVVTISREENDQVPAYSDLEKRFLLNLKEFGVLTVGTETSDAPRSEIPLFQSVDISSVDNIESRIGQVSVVYVLSGEKGAFGVKPTADLLIPILRTSKQPTPASSTPAATATTATAPPTP